MFYKILIMVLILQIIINIQASRITKEKEAESSLIEKALISFQHLIESNLEETNIVEFERIQKEIKDSLKDLVKKRLRQSAITSFWLFRQG